MKRAVKVFRSGSNGLVVTLPADWVRGLNLLPGTLLEMQYSDDEVILRLPPKTAPTKNLMVEAAKIMVKAARI